MPDPGSAGSVPVRRFPQHDDGGNLTSVWLDEDRHGRAGAPGSFGQLRDTRLATPEAKDVTAAALFEQEAFEVTEAVMDETLDFAGAFLQVIERPAVLSRRGRVRRVLRGRRPQASARCRSEREESRPVDRPSA